MLLLGFGQLLFFGQLFFQQLGLLAELGGFFGGLLGLGGELLAQLLYVLLALGGQFVGVQQGLQLLRLRLVGQVVALQLFLHLVQLGQQQFVFLFAGLLFGLAHAGLGGMALGLLVFFSQLLLQQLGLLAQLGGALAGLGLRRGQAGLLLGGLLGLLLALQVLAFQRFLHLVQLAQQQFVFLLGGLLGLLQGLLLALQFGQALLAGGGLAVVQAGLFVYDALALLGQLFGLGLRAAEAFDELLLLLGQGFGVAQALVQFVDLAHLGVGQAGLLLQALLVGGHGQPGVERGVRVDDHVGAASQGQAGHGLQFFIQLQAAGVLAQQGVGHKEGQGVFCWGRASAWGGGGRAAEGGHGLGGGGCFGGFFVGWRCFRRFGCFG